MSELRIDLRETLERVNVPSLIADRDGVVTWINEAGRRAFGDLVGKPVTSFAAPEEADAVRAQFDRKLRGVPVTNYEVEVVTADGRRRTAEISSVVIPGGDRCQAIFGVAHTLAPSVRARAPNLTPRQTEVLRLLGEGASTVEIASTLQLSRETVRNHVRHLLRALGARSRLEAVAIAHRKGLLRDAEG